eukprot:8383492-Pyramimonas_sp.AAC.1
MGKRVIHALPAVSKFFFLFFKRLNVRFPPQAYGFARHKRREGAILVTQCLSWRLRQSQVSFANAVKDLSSAFGSVSWATFDSTVEDCAKPEDWNLCKRHYRDGVIEMQGDEGAFYMKPHVGGLMGGPFIVSAFLGSFTRPTEYWSAAM